MEGRWADVEETATLEVEVDPSTVSLQGCFALVDQVRLEAENEKKKSQRIP
jgi:hypothetical protein